MIEYLIEAGLSTVIIYLVFFIIGVIIILVSVILDFLFARKKYRKEGVLLTHSRGLRDTGSKFAEYLAILVLCAFVDIVNPVWYLFGMTAIPIFIMGSIAFTVFTEFKSIKEKTSDKFRKALNNNPDEIIKIILDKKEDIKNILK